MSGVTIVDALEFARQVHEVKKQESLQEASEKDVALSCGCVLTVLTVLFVVLLVIWLF